MQLGFHPVIAVGKLVKK